ncbi:MAG: ABC transporter permease [Candidatus Solibacter usitatus]|nr:ABC transporter permease [Candidatus Solibacter usitatus]
MTLQFRMRQAWTIARIEMRRAFFSRRALWVYLLALFPAVIFIGHGIEMTYRHKRWSGQGTTPAAALDSVNPRDTAEEVLKKAGKPITDRDWRRRKLTEEEETEKGGRIRRYEMVEGRMMMYYDGRRSVRLFFEDGVLKDKSIREEMNFDQDRQAYAGVFQYFYLRLAIFFGCLGIFMNLFRGEMLDKTLHYWFLAPARRDVLLAGKYLAGLTASTVIFTGGAMLSFAGMLWPHESAAVAAYWSGPGMGHLFWYAASAALACVGYGSVFLAAGLLLRNPIIPAAVLLVWESINGFLPDLLQKLSVLYYVQSLCPVPAPADPGMPPLLRTLLSPATPAAKEWAVLGVLAVTVLVLWAAAGAVRRIEINYSTE